MTLPLRRLISRFAKDRSGFAAVEFALVIPVMLVFLIGSVELSNAWMAARKATLTASTLADLVAQDITITNAEVADVLNAATSVMYPLSTSGMGLRVTSVVAGMDGVARVAWSEARNMAPRPTNAVMAMPSGMLTPGSSVIYSEVQMVYVPKVGKFLTNGISISEQFYLRPRRSIQVLRAAS